MMNEIEYLLAAILVMAISTYLTRLTPFLMFTPGKENAKLNFVAKNTPPMVMMILVIYMLKEVDYLSTEIFYTLFALSCYCRSSNFKEKRIIKYCFWDYCLYVFCSNVIWTIMN